MKLTTDQTIIPLFQQENGADCDLIAYGSDVRFIAQNNNTLAGVSGWLVREADADLVATAAAKVLTMTNAGDGAKLRVGETINCYNVSDVYLGSIVVKDITGEVINFEFGGSEDFKFTTEDITYVKILTDPLLTDKDPREFISAKMKHVVVKAIAACELAIIPLTRSGVEQ